MLDPTDPNYIRLLQDRSYHVELCDEFAEFIKPREREAWIDGSLSVTYFFGVIRLRMLRRELISS